MALLNDDGYGDECDEWVSIYLYEWVLFQEVLDVLDVMHVMHAMDVVDAKFADLQEVVVTVEAVDHDYIMRDVHDEDDDDLMLLMVL